ncbi:MAG: alpha-glucosidase [Bacteroidota bacterium]
MDKELLFSANGSEKREWWKEAVIYQIYPRSFKDSNDDGIGDLRGIIEKIDHLDYLGVDVVWLGPVYKSPNDDNGYDISNYKEIHPEFGSMADFEELLIKLNRKGIKLIMDLVVNHSSDEHPWFIESKKSKDNSFRDFYFWREGVEGREPNNWKSFFGGSAWTKDEITDQYYLHLFSRKQPDLNWENPKVRKEIYQIIEFWCEKGIDGFRMDVISLISKPMNFNDSPHEDFLDTVKYVYANGPKVHHYIQEMYDKVLKNYDIMTVGEGPGIHKEVGLSYVQRDKRELNMIFHLDHMFLGAGKLGRIDARPHALIDFKRLFSDWNEAMGDQGWLSIFLDNHDFPRMVSRFGNDKDFRSESAKMLAILILTQRGTPCIYQGSEIGMTNMYFNREEDFRDVEILNFFKEIKVQGDDMENAMHLANLNGRDNVRTPMQWSTEKQAGFTKGQSWIAVNPNFRDINVASSLKDPNSILNFYKDILAFRKTCPTMIYGNFEDLLPEDEQLYIYRRYTDKNEFLIQLNFSDQTIELDDYSFKQNVEFRIGNYPEHSINHIKPWEGRVYQLL